MSRLIQAAMLAAVYLVPSTIALAAESATLSTSDFIRPSEFTEVRLSPDGKYISALVPRPGTPLENMLAIIDTATVKPVSTIRSGNRTMIYQYRWVNDQRLVMSLAMRLNGLEKPSRTGELVAFDADGSHGLYVFGARDARRHQAYATLIDGPATSGGNHIVVQTQPFTKDRAGSVPSISFLDVASGYSMPMIDAPATDATIVIDNSREARAASSSSMGFPQLWLRNTRGQWTLFNDSRTSGITISPIGFNRDNSRLYVSVSHADGPDSIELLDPQSGKRTLVYRGQFGDPGKLLRTADGKDFYAVVTTDGVQGIHYLDPNSQEAQISEALRKSFPGQLVKLTSFTTDGKLAIVNVSSDRDPGDYYLFDLEKQQARYLFSERRWLSPGQMRPMQPISISARDGLILHGFLTEPKGKGPFPMVVMPHGGPHVIYDQWAFNEETQLLASRGYAVLQVNFRGSGGYGATFTQRGYGQWGLSMQDDITDATQWAIREGGADASRICIFGSSYGGYAAIEGAIREPDLYRCAIGYAGVYDLRIQLDKSDTQRTDEGAEYLKHELGDDRDDLLRRSPIAGIDRIKVDLMLIHGELDARAPFANFKTFAAELKRQGKHYEALTEAQEGHGFFLESHRQKLYDKLLDFLDQHIGRSAGTVAAGSP